MKKNFKKIIALLLSVLMLMSVMAVGVSAEENAAEGTEPAEEEYRGFIQIMVDMFMEFIDFIVFIFYGVFRGETA